MNNFSTRIKKRAVDLYVLKRKTSDIKYVARLNGAGSRGRTDTVLLPSDFESDASANSTIPAFAQSELRIQL